MRLLVLAGGRYDALLATMNQAVPVEDVEADELRSFIATASTF